MRKQPRRLDDDSSINIAEEKQNENWNKLRAYQLYQTFLKLFKVCDKIGEMEGFFVAFFGKDASLVESAGILNYKLILDQLGIVEPESRK